MTTPSPASPPPLWVAEREVVELIDLPRAIDAVEEAFALEAAGAATTMPKAHLAWGGGHTLHAIGGVIEGRGLVGTKTWAHTGGGATPLLLLWDAAGGALLAVVEAFALGQLRTAAVSGVATRRLAAPGAGTLAIVGTGRQALPQVAAVCAVRPISLVRAYSPTPSHRSAFAEAVRGAGLGVAVEVAASVGAAVAGAEVVTTATRARTAFLSAGDLAAGAHVNAVGAVTPERRELDASLVAGAALVVADSPEAARRLTTELRDAADIVPLSSVVAGVSARPAGPGPTVFKAMGVGLADVALGAAVLDAARTDGAGRPLPTPVRAHPRLSTNRPGGTS